jgi:hypothetical protein
VQAALAKARGWLSYLTSVDETPLLNQTRKYTTRSSNEKTSASGARSRTGDETNRKRFS